MKIAYLLSPGSVHSHDFGVDYLLHGLFSVLGFENVLDYPEKDSLHVTPDRVPCTQCTATPYECDQEWPRKGHSFNDAMRACDVLVIATQVGDLSVLDTAKTIAQQWPRNRPIVAVDSSDSVADTNGAASLNEQQEYYRVVAGRPLAAYFKRELPIGDHWALPLPLSYPRARIPTQMPSKKIHVFYHAAQYKNERAGRPRMQMMQAIKALRLPSDVRLYDDPHIRLTPDEYHASMAQSLIGLSWNGYPFIMNWDCNRFWENFAFGLAQVAERPRIRIPHAPVDNVHCVYVDRIDEAASALAELVADPERALQMAAAGHAHFLAWHCSEARAAYFINLLNLLC